jgi:hypothetical protein
LQEQELLQDEAKATTEFETRLRKQVHLNGGVLVIRDAELSDWVSVAPASTIWIVNCGPYGLDVSFGAVSGENNGDSSVTLTRASIPAEECERIATSIGETVLAITRGN